MKKKIIFGIILGLVMFSFNCFAQKFEQEDPLSPMIDDTIMLASDSLEIVQIKENKFFVVCTTCEVLSSHGYMRRIIVDSLSYISPDIPRDYWLEAYSTKQVTYKHKLLLSRLELKNWKPIMTYVWQDSEAIYASDSLKSISTSYISSENYNSLLSSKFSANYFLLFVVIVGFIWFIMSLDTGIKKSLHAYGELATGLGIAIIFYFTFGKTLAAFILPLIAFVLGAFIPLIITRLIKILIRSVSKN